MTQQFSSSSKKDERTGRETGNLYLISEESITFILHPGVNKIHTPGTNRPDVVSSSEEGAGEDMYLLEENVGIIPLSGPARITTRGFQWDVDNWKTEIGGQISTSNHIRSEVVVVESAMSVLFTLELAGRFKRVR
jgi:thiamine pyrophosphokinase